MRIQLCSSLLILGLAACGEESSPISEPELDASVPPTVDSSLSNPVDAAVPDANVRDARSPDASAPDAAVATADVVLRDGHLADGAGNTLYYFAKDAPGVSRCYGECEDAWPIFAAAEPTVGEGLDAAAFAQITRDDGTPQTTYRGWPLYYYAGDDAPGVTSGEGLGNVWFVLPEPFYTVMLGSSEASTRPILVSPEGGTLYYFAKDTPSTTAPTSACQGECLAAWPIFDADSLVLPSTLDASDFVSFDRTDAVPQTAYRGFPLYYYASDAPGESTGEGRGNVWFVAPSPFYDALVMAEEAHPHYVADGAGRSLYLFLADTRGTADADPVSACTTERCLTNWPIFGAADLAITSNFVAADFTTFTRPDGVVQAAYRGYPLYYYVGDAAPGDTNGHGVGDVWELIDPTTLE